MISLPDDLHLHVATAPGGRCAVTLAGTVCGTSLGRCETSLPDLLRLEQAYLRPLRSFARGTLPPGLLEALGRELAGFLFAGDVGEGLALVLDHSPVKARVRVRLSVEPPELRGLPWEYARAAFRREDAGYLCLDSRVELVRASGPLRELEPISLDRLRVLVAWADPGTARFPPLAHLRPEIRSVLAALAVPECRVEVEELPAATPASLARCLAERPPHILHFIGHGEAGPEGGCLALQGEAYGTAEVLPGSRLAGWAAEHGLRLVVLSACDTAGTGGGVAEPLAAGGVPAVVAMQLPLRDAGAALFSRAFYAALAEAAPVEEALRQGRQAVRGVGADWGVPVLYLGVRTGSLFRAAPRVVPNTVPYLRNPYFVGREQVLEEVHAALTGPGPLPVALVGMGGQGKTQLAVEYAHRHAAAYPGGIFWLNAQDTQHLEDDYAALGRFFGIPADRTPRERARLVRDQLAQLREPALCILDNLTTEADDQAAGPDGVGSPAYADWLLPPGPRCRVLATTRARHLVRDRFRIVSLSPLDEAAALRLLQAHHAPEGPTEEAASREIVALLGGLPLALALASSQMDRLWTSFSAYRDRLANNRFEALGQARHRFVTGTGHSGSVWDTLDISFRSLSRTQRGVLTTAAFFGAQGIAPDRLFAASGRHSRETFQEALADLRDYSLATRERDGRLSLHELVRVYARGQLSLRSRKSTLRRVGETLSDWLRGEVESMRWAAARPEIPHAEAAAAFCAEHGLPDLHHCLLRGVGEYRLHQGDPDEAKRCFLRALESVRSVEEPPGLETADLLRLAGLAHQHGGDAEGARAVMTQALELAERYLDSTDAACATYYNAFGYVLKRQGDLAAALPLYRRALEVTERAHGRSHPSISTCLNNIGTLLEAQGNPEEALRHLCEALDIDRGLLGPEHPRIAIRRNNIGRNLARVGDWQSALEHHVEALRIYRAAYEGADHVDLVQTLFYCVEPEIQLGLREAASAHFLEMLDMRVRLNQPPPPEVQALAAQLDL